MPSFGGNIPHQLRSPDGTSIRPIFFSRREIALLLSKTVSPGFGELKAGTILAENVSNLSTGNKGLLVPYMPDTISTTDTGRTFLTQTPGASDSFVYVPLDDSYRFAVGDDIVIGYATTYTNGGAITAIDRTTYPNQAKITFTTAFAGTGASYTVAAKACCWPECGTSGKYSTAKYILEQAVDTGNDEDAKGALASVVISNATLYKGNLTNYDSQAATDLSATTDGQYLILK